MNVLLLIILLLLPMPAWAAIACGDAIEFNDATPTTPETISYTTPAGSNQVLFVGVGRRDTGPGAITVTHAGNAMTATSTGTVFQSPVSAELFYIVNPTSGTNDVVADYGGDTPLADAIIIWTCSGVDTTSPVHDATEASGASTAVTLTVPNLVAGDMVVDFFFADIQTADPTEGANQTVLHEGNDGAEAGWGASYQAGADGGVMSWTIQNQEWTQQGVALTAAADTILQSPPLPRLLFE